MMHRVIAEGLLVEIGGLDCYFRRRPSLNSAHKVQSSRAAGRPGACSPTSDVGVRVASPPRHQTGKPAPRLRRFNPAARALSPTFSERRRPSLNSVHKVQSSRAAGRPAAGSPTSDVGVRVASPPRHQTGKPAPRLRRFNPAVRALSLRLSPSAAGRSLNSAHKVQSSRATGRPGAGSPTSDVGVRVASPPRHQTGKPAPRLRRFNPAVRALSPRLSPSAAGRSLNSAQKVQCSRAAGRPGACSPTSDVGVRVASPPRHQTGKPRLV